MIPADRITDTERDAIAPLLLHWHRDACDAEIHSAAGRALLRLGISTSEMVNAVPSELRQRQANVDALRKRIAAFDDSLGSDREMKKKESWKRGIQRVRATTKGLVFHLHFDRGQEFDYRGTQEDEDEEPLLEQSLFGQGIRLSGGSVVWPDAPMFDADEAISYGCWFWISDEAKRRCALIGKITDPPASHGWGLSAEPNEEKIYAEWTHQWPEDAMVLQRQLPGLVLHWHHLFVTYDGSRSIDGAQVYLDGVPLRTYLGGKKVVRNTVIDVTNLRVGRRETDYAFHGMIDEVRIYDRQLNEKEVSEIVLSDLGSLIQDTPAFWEDEARRLIDRRYFLIQNESVQDDRTRLSQARRVWSTNSLGMTMIHVDTSSDVRDAEGLKSFLLMDREVTNRWYVTYLEQSGRDPEQIKIEFNDDPVSNVSWVDAAQFCNWLSEFEGLTPYYAPTDTLFWNHFPEANGYRLPTVAEWTFACRAGTTTDFPCGDEEYLDRYAVYSTERVARGLSKLSNPWGFFDMHGNLTEWCHDPYPNSHSHLLIGGSFVDVPTKLKYSQRFPMGRQVRFDSVGFRVARNVPE